MIGCVLKEVYRSATREGVDIILSEFLHGTRECSRDGGRHPRRRGRSAKAARSTSWLSGYFCDVELAWGPLGVL